MLNFQFIFFSFIDLTFLLNLQKEFWSLRPIKDEINCEEELYVCGQTAVWSFGSSNSEHSGSSRHVKSCYTLNSPIKHALWCTFHISPQDKLYTNNYSGKEDLGNYINFVKKLRSILKISVHVRQYMTKLMTYYCKLLISISTVESKLKNVKSMYL